MRIRFASFIAFSMLFPCMLYATQAMADSARQLYEQAMVLAAEGDEKEAIARLAGGGALLPERSIWKQRYSLAAGLLSMRLKQEGELALNGSSPQAVLLSGYIRRQPLPQPSSSLAPAVLATVIPGAGHAWLQRWRDAGVAAMMVWPMLLLTIWAARRRMGPVTIFFGLITVWLWSGTVFSAMSLAERIDAESYAFWWKGLWQASGLPGRPW